MVGHLSGLSHHRRANTATPADYSRNFVGWSSNSVKSAAMAYEERGMSNVRFSSQPIHEGTMQRLRRLARLMDNAVNLPGTRFRIGLDPLLGLIPGAGDAVTACISLYMIVQARRLGVSNQVLTAMVVNVAVDALVGAVPVLGDLFDFAFKANSRNLVLLEKHLAARRETSPCSPQRIFAQPKRLVAIG